MSDTTDPRQAAYAAARAEWMRVVWAALERHRDAREEQEEEAQDGA